ncbi:Zinc finger, CCHC-type [Sesbania bispinosa]|nr:Zinc finger, CCHC-type [Sesbania bispinosa]
MPPRTRIIARRESSGEFASQPHDPLQRGRGRGCSRGRRGFNAGVLEGVEYDWFDTVTRGRLVRSPPLAWGEFSRLFMARFLPGSVRDGLAHEFERLEQTEGLREYIFRSVVGYNCSTFAEVQQRAVSQRGGSSGQSLGTTQSRRSDQGRSSRTTFPQRHFGVTSTPCPTCGRLHTRVCFGDSRVCYQCGQTSHIRRDCPVAVMQPSSSHASAPAALESSQAPSAPVRQLGGSSGRGYGVAHRVVEGLVVEVRHR